MRLDGLNSVMYDEPPQGQGPRRTAFETEEPPFLYNVTHCSGPMHGKVRCGRGLRPLRPLPLPAVTVIVIAAWQSHSSPLLALSDCFQTGHSHRSRAIPFLAPPGRLRLVPYWALPWQHRDPVPFFQW